VAAGAERRMSLVRLALADGLVETAIPSRVDSRVRSHRRAEDRPRIAHSVSCRKSSMIGASFCRHGLIVGNSASFRGRQK